jgi:hypothetical protein
MPPVPAAEYPFQMIGRVPVITTPPEIDFVTSGELRAILSQWHSRGHTTMVVDLTWSVAAMSDATARLPAMKVWDKPRALPLTARTPFPGPRSADNPAVR